MILRAASAEPSTFALIKVLTCLMFFLFAMTTDAVGSVIPVIIQEFRLTLTAAGTFHYVPMGAIALGALILGFLADRWGRRATIIVGLTLYAIGSGLFALGRSFGFFVLLLSISGLGISVFKIGALALIGDITKSATQHTSLMNSLEGFFGIGSIVGPALVAVLIAAGASWKWLYVVAAGVCVVLIVCALMVEYPRKHRLNTEVVALKQTFELLGDPWALGFSLLIALYVSVEVAIYVWMPTYLLAYDGEYRWLSTYALTLFFVFRAAGRFLGALFLSRLQWTSVMALCGLSILACFAGSLVLGVRFGVLLLPLSGLFMSTVYPTLNSKGISCFPRAHHGAIAGIILFFTAAAAALSPLAMAAVSDLFGSVRYGFVLATAFAFLLFVGLAANWMIDPAKGRLLAVEHGDIAPAPI
jgi:MFS transporter, DHA1 family, quinolone resistance protein